MIIDHCNAIKVRNKYRFILQWLNHCKMKRTCGAKVTDLLL